MLILPSLNILDSFPSIFNLMYPISSIVSILLICSFPLLLRILSVSEISIPNGNLFLSLRLFAPFSSSSSRISSSSLSIALRFNRILSYCDNFNSSTIESIFSLSKMVSKSLNSIVATFFSSLSLTTSEPVISFTYASQWSILFTLSIVTVSLVLTLVARHVVEFEYSILFSSRNL